MSGYGRPAAVYEGQIHELETNSTCTNLDMGRNCMVYKVVGDKFYSFGEWILGTGSKLIDLHDRFWDEIEANIKEVLYRGLD